MSTRDSNSWDKNNPVINPMAASDIPIMTSQFAKFNWPKPTATFEAYLKDQQSGERLVWVAHVNDQ